MKIIIRDNLHAGYEVPYETIVGLMNLGLAFSKNFDGNTVLLANEMTIRNEDMFNLVIYCINNMFAAKITYVANKDVFTMLITENG